MEQTSSTYCLVIETEGPREHLSNPFSFLCPLSRSSSQLPDDKRLGILQISSLSVGSKEPIVSAPIKTLFNSGVIHLYRLTRIIKDPPPQGPCLLAILAVPTLMTPTDLVNFLGSFVNHILHLYLIRDSLPNRYMVLLHMSDYQFGNELIRELNGVKYNSLEHQVCHVVTIDSIQMSCASAGDTVAETTDRVSIDQTLLELPTCPVCLERLDSSVTGLLTSICNHTFHCSCIAKWGQGSCPVCRYSTTEETNSDDTSVCRKCGTGSNLWICLICGHIGCGRYKAGHAQEHFSESTHLYALEIETQRVWDYAGDGYVHRLLRNREDGKLVELGLPSSSTDVPPSIHSSPEKQNEASQGDFATLLVTQLESQRMYFESLVSKIEQTHESELSHLLNRIDALSLDHHHLSVDKEQAVNTLDSLKKERKSLDRKLDKYLKRLDELDRELREEKALTASLMADQTHYKSAIESRDISLSQKDEEIAELKEQVRDLMFYLQTLISHLKIVNSQEHLSLQVPKKDDLYSTLLEYDITNPKV